MPNYPYKVEVEIKIEAVMWELGRSDLEYLWVHNTVHVEAAVFDGNVHTEAMVVIPVFCNGLEDDLAVEEIERQDTCGR